MWHSELQSFMFCGKACCTHLLILRNDSFIHTFPIDESPTLDLIMINWLICPCLLPAFFLTAHFSEEDYPYDWLMLWLSRRPEWQRSREFETTTRTTTPGFSRTADYSFGDDEEECDDEIAPGKVKTRVVFQPTFDTTHTIYYRGHWLRVRRGRKTDGSGCEILSIR